MTTCIGIQGDGFAVLASDSRYSTDAEIFTATIPKIQANGPYLFGGSGSARALNLVHYAFKPPVPSPNLKGRKLDQFITVQFIPALRHCYETGGYGLARPGGPAEIDSDLLLAINGCIYVIDDDYAWVSGVDGVYAIGSGSTVARGALEAVVYGKVLSIPQTKAAALKVMKITAKLTLHTGPPFHTFVQNPVVK